MDEEGGGGGGWGRDGAYLLPGESEERSNLLEDGLHFLALGGLVHGALERVSEGRGVDRLVELGGFLRMAFDGQGHVPSGFVAEELVEEEKKEAVIARDVAAELQQHVRYVAAGDGAGGLDALSQEENGRKSAHDELTVATVLVHGRPLTLHRHVAQMRPGLVGGIVDVHHVVVFLLLAACIVVRVRPRGAAVHLGERLDARNAVDVAIVSGHDSDGM